MHGGATAREHLEAVERRTGHRSKELDEAEIPKEATHVWQWFLELHSARGGNGFGANPISYTEMAAWSEITGNRPRQHEWMALRMLDSVYLEMEAERHKK